MGKLKREQVFSMHLTLDADATPTAGSIIVYDSLTETGTVIYSGNF